MLSKMIPRQRQADIEGEQPLRQYKEYSYTPYTPQEASQQKTFGTVPRNQNPSIYTNQQTTLPTPMTDTTYFSGNMTPLMSSSSESLIIVPSNPPNTKTSQVQPQAQQQSQLQFNQQSQPQFQYNQQYQSQPQFNQQQQKVTIYVMTKAGGCIPINIPLEYLRMHVSKSDFNDIALLQ